MDLGIAGTPVPATPAKTTFKAVKGRTASSSRLGPAGVEAAPARASWRQRIAALALAVTISACAVVQPHVDVPPSANVAPPVFAGDLYPQLVRGKLLQQRYMDQVSNETLLTNSLAITAIPLSAAALAVGITNPGTTATRNFLTGAGLGVAAALGLGSFLVDRRRDAIYYGGAKSIYCLAVAITPLAIEAAEFAKMRQDVEQLRLDLAAAAAAGVPQSLIDQGNTNFAAGRRLVRETAQAGSAFANELDKINIAVNAQIASEDRTIADIGGSITAIQKNLPEVAGPPVSIARTQGGRREAAGRASIEVRLRRSVELVTGWIAVYRSTAAATTEKLQAAQCLPATAAGPPPVQPIIVVTNGQGVTIEPPGAGVTAPSVITVQPPPPRIARPHAPPPIPSAEPPADISSDEMKQLRAVFGLTSTNATLPNSPLFKNKVSQFQRCKGDPATGRLTDKEKAAALSANDACIPQPGGGSPGGAPVPADNLPRQPPPPPTH